MPILIFFSISSGLIYNEPTCCNHQHDRSSGTHLHHQSSPAATIRWHHPAASALHLRLVCAAFCLHQPPFYLQMHHCTSNALHGFLISLHGFSLKFVNYCPKSSIISLNCLILHLFSLKFTLFQQNKEDPSRLMMIERRCNMILSRIDYICQENQLFCTL